MIRKPVVDHMCIAAAMKCVLAIAALSFLTRCTNGIESMETYYTNHKQEVEEIFRQYKKIESSLPLKSLIIRVHEDHTADVNIGLTESIYGGFYFTKDSIYDARVDKTAKDDAYARALYDEMSAVVRKEDFRQLIALINNSELQEIYSERDFIYMSLGRKEHWWEIDDNSVGIAMSETGENLPMYHYIRSMDKRTILCELVVP